MYNFVRYFDFASTSVSFRLNKSDTYSSFASGLCSLIMILVVMTYGVIELFQVFETPHKFKERSQMNYLPLSNDTEVFSAPISDFVPAL